MGHRIPFGELTDGRGITIYGQQEVVKDLIAARLDAGAELLFEVDDVSVHGLDSEQPSIRFRHDGEQRELRCDVIAGCDGFHGVCRDSLPEGVLTVHERTYPFAWLGILARVAPSHEELIYCHHDRGFALHSMRSPEVTRLYLQCDPDEDIDDWPDERIWEELHLRFASDGWSLTEGPVIEKGITPMRSFVAAPMQHGRLYLAGDAVHIVPPTGAKGLNLAVADVRVLAAALVASFESGDDSLLRSYSDTCLRRVWRTQFFSWWMTSMFHRMPDDHDGFQARLQRAQLAYVVLLEGRGHVARGELRGRRGRHRLTIGKTNCLMYSVGFCRPARHAGESRSSGRETQDVAELMSLDEAVRELVHDGDTVALEGFTHLIPFAAGHEIVRQRRRDLTLIRMTPDLVYDQLIGMGCARKLVFSWGGNPGWDRSAAFATR